MTSELSHELVPLTLFIEKEIKPQKWRLHLGPIYYEVASDLLSLEMKGLPEDIGDETIRAGFLPIKKRTDLDDAGEMISISQEDADYESNSWGAIQLGKYFLFATQEDCSYFSFDDFKFNLTSWQKLLGEDFQQFQDEIHSIEGGEEFLQARVLVALS